MTSDFLRAADHVLRMADSHSPAATKKQLDSLSRKATKAWDVAVRLTPSKEGSLADASMSHWRRSNPIHIGVRSKVTMHGSDGEMRVDPTPAARGPMRVLESGRKSYAKGDKRVAGTRLRKKTNDRVLKYRKIKRNIAGTAGKGTWTRAETAASTALNAEVTTERLRAVARVFGR